MGEGNGPESTVLKVVIIGDGAVGKTALMVRYRDGEFPNEYIPTVFEMNTKNVEVAGEQFELRLWDTAGQEAYEELRKQVFWELLEVREGVKNFLPNLQKKNSINF